MYPASRREEAPFPDRGACQDQRPGASRARLIDPVGVGGLPVPRDQPARCLERPAACQLPVSGPLVDLLDVPALNAKRCKREGVVVRVRVSIWQVDVMQEQPPSPGARAQIEPTYVEPALTSNVLVAQDCA